MKPRTNKTVRGARRSRARRAAPLDLRGLIATWERRADGPAWDGPAPYSDAGRRSLELGAPTLAYEILRHGLLAYPQERELSYLAALAAARLGSYRDASSLLSSLAPKLTRRDPLYVDVKSLEGRIAKDLWARLPEGDAKQAAGERSAAAYAAAHEASGAYFPAINAATLHALLGREADSRRLAEETRRRCAMKSDGGSKQDPWLFATLGEASLLLHEPEEAMRWYRRAASAMRGRVGDVASMRRQLRLLSARFPAAREAEAAIALPQVVVFTGHMLDRPGRREARFPERIEAAVAGAVAEELERARAGFGYCSAACGADIIFIEQMLERGAEVHVTLPFARADFLETSVAFAGTGWVERFHRALTHATRVTQAVDERYLGDDNLFEYTASLTQGAALLRAQQLETGVLQLAVLDAADLESRGGTRSAVDAWSRLGLASRTIELGALRGPSPVPRQDDDASRPVAPRSRREVKTMLFADMVGFSRLQEQDTPAFLVHFLGEIARVVARAAAKPAFLNTWGDGLFMVFDSTSTAAGFALELRDAVRDTDWRRHGLPAETSIRIGMHSGPVFPAEDPIIGRRNFFGAHVNRAARIEPVTVPGAVYVSEQTAALLAASGAREFACDYLGSVPLAKHFGDSVLYRLRRAHESE